VPIAILVFLTLSLLTGGWNAAGKAGEVMITRGLTRTFFQVLLSVVLTTAGMALATVILDVKIWGGFIFGLISIAIPMAVFIGSLHFNLRRREMSAVTDMP